VPGGPAPQADTLGSGAAAHGWWASPAPQRKRQASTGIELPALAREGSDQVQLFGAPSAQPWAASLMLRIAPDVMARLDPQRLDDAVARMRAAVRTTWGLPFPGVALSSDAPSGTVAVDVHGIPAIQFAVPSDHRLLIAPPNTRVPALAGGQRGPELLGLGSHWTPSAPDGVDASALHEPEAVLALVLKRLIDLRPHKFFGVQEALVLSQRLEAELPELEREMRQAVPLPRLAEIGRALLEEGVSLSHLAAIAQALVDHAAREKDTAQLVEKVRRSLSDQITHQHTNARGELAAVILSPELEDQLAAAVRVSSRGSHLALPTTLKESLLSAIGDAFQARSVAGLRAVLLVHTPEIRLALRALLRESDMGERTVLAVDELRPNLNVLVISEVAASVLQGRAPGDTVR
jgi:type III secretory pathway component EscV